MGRSLRSGGIDCRPLVVPRDHGGASAYWAQNGAPPFVEAMAGALWAGVYAPGVVPIRAAYSGCGGPRAAAKTLRFWSAGLFVSRSLPILATQGRSRISLQRRSVCL